MSGLSERHLKRTARQLEDIEMQIDAVSADLMEYVGRAVETCVTGRQADQLSRNWELLNRISERAVSAAQEMEGEGTSIEVHEPEMPSDPQLRGVVQKVIAQPPGREFDAAATGADAGYLRDHSYLINRYVPQVFSDHLFTEVPASEGGGPTIFALGEIIPPEVIPLPPPNPA